MCVCYKYSGRNKGQKLDGHFLKIDFVGYWLPSHWKCAAKLTEQDGFLSAKCCIWLENGQWLTVISSTASSVEPSTSALALHGILVLYYGFKIL